MKRKIKILRVINRLNLGGPTYNVSYLSKYIGDDFETLLVAGMKLDSEESSEFITEKYNIKPLYLKYMFREINLFKDYKAYVELKRVIKDFKPDIVHTHAAKSGAIGRLAAISQNVPFIYHTFHGHVFHSYFGKFKTFLYLLIERWLAHKSTKIIAISSKQKIELVNLFKICSSKKMEIITLGFDLSRFQEDIITKRTVFRLKYNLDDNDIAIGIVGRLTPIKNHRFFLDIVNKISKKINRSIRFFIIGDGEDTVALKDYCNELNLSFSSHNDEIHDKLICFTSWLKEMDQVYAGLDIVTLTSLNEGTPVTLIEALASNKAVVATRVGGVEDVVNDKFTGFLCESNDINDFSEKLHKLIINNELRHEFSSRGYLDVAKKYSYIRLVDDMRVLYKKSLRNIFS